MTVDRYAAPSAELDSSIESQDLPGMESEDSAGPNVEEEIVLTEDMVHPWLARIRPAVALSLLREPEYAAIAAHAFTGFRLNTQGYANPIVRRRLAQVAVKIGEFADQLRQLSEDAVTPAQVQLERPAPSSPPQPPKQDEAASEQANIAQKNGLAVLRTDRDRRRRERDEARAGLEELQKAFAAANAARLNAESEAHILQKTTERQARRIERFERQIAKLRSEQTSLLRALSKQQPLAPSPAQVIPQGIPQVAIARESHWENAVRRFLDRGHSESALLLAEDTFVADRGSLADVTEQSGCGGSRRSC